MNKNKPDVYESSDYAGVSANGFSAYYGYEQTICSICKGMNCRLDDHDSAEKEWCFVANFNGQEIVIPRSKLCSDHEGMLLPLLTGIGWLFAKYKLVPIEEKP